MSTVDDAAKSLQNFGWSDYAVFGLMLAICMAIGVYFSQRGRKRQKKEFNNGESEAVHYLFGGRRLKVFPVSVSLIASSLSGIGLLGTSTEIYIYGSQYVLTLISVVFVGIVLHFLILPVYHEMKLMSVYEYLDRRFNRWLRLFGSMLYLISTFVKIPIIAYVPVMAFNQITGIEIYITLPIVCFICIFYTCIGGLKAVVWTDVVQGFVMLGSLIVVAVKATIDVGGLGTVIERNLASTRIEAPIFSMDPTIRSAFWSVVIGGWCNLFSINGVEQSMIQRYVSLPTMRQARKAVWIFVVGYCITTAFAMYNGFLLYAMYHDCDPLSTGLVKKPDQLISLLVADTLSGLPLLSGCFIAGVFSASLSTVSTSLNSMSAVILEDFVKLSYGGQLSERTTAYVLRGSVVLIGLIATALSFVVDRLGPVLALAISVQAVTYGPLLGVFIVGLTMPWIGSVSTLVGALSGLITATVIVVKAQIDTASGALTYASKPVSTGGCLYAFNATATPSVESEKEFYHISYLYHCFVGVFVTVLVANLLSLFIERQSAGQVNTELLAPPIRRWYKSKYIKVPVGNGQAMLVLRNEKLYLPSKQIIEVF